MPSGAARTFTLAGRLGVPSNAVAVTGSIAVVGQTSAGYLSLGPSAATVSRSSVVNTPKGDIRAAGFTVKVGAGGSVAALWTGAGGSTAHVIVDVTGYYVPGTAGSTFVPLTPARVLDTRIGTGLSGSFVSGSPRTLHGRRAPGGCRLAPRPSPATSSPSRRAANGYLSIGATRLLDADRVQPECPRRATPAPRRSP